MDHQTEYSDIHIETTLPKPWEEEATFNDVLYDWMGRAPWLMISAAAHVLVFFVLMAIPWAWLNNDDETIIEASIDAVPEDIFEEEEEEEEEIIEEEVIEEPVLQDAELEEESLDETDDWAEGDPDFSSDSNFESDNFNDVIGVGGGAGGKFGRRFGTGKGKMGGGRGVHESLERGLSWLRDHQSPEGHWDCDNFMNNNVLGGCSCEDDGYPSHDVGVTALALLAFMGNGNTSNQGQYKDVVARGIAWLNNQQDPDTGQLGDSAAHEFIYNHAIATLALSESYYFSKSPRIKKTVKRAVKYIQDARAPYAGWRYDAPSLGDSDTSVTGWMLFALASAKGAGIDIDQAALVDGLGVIDEFTDLSTGRIGYDSPGSQSSRTAANKDDYPRDKGEAMTAVGLLCRIFLTDVTEDTPERQKLWESHADLLQKLPPEWDEDGFGNDMYYWYYGTYAMFQMGGKYWNSWKGQMEKAVVDSQRADGDFKGSWDPNGPWGYAGGRVYSTALMVLCLEVYFRYAKVLGAR